MHESLVLMNWIRATLAADATIAGLVGTRIYEGVAPQPATFPLILVTVFDNPDLRGVGAARIVGVHEALVRAADKSTTYAGTLQTLAERIDALLHGKEGATSPSGRVVACSRLAPASMVEVADGVTYRYLGGRYRGLTQA